jgi:8-oxo-dGTP pyrophosphatase MutT (NUDIX family)
VHSALHTAVSRPESAQIDFARATRAQLQLALTDTEPDEAAWNFPELADILQDRVLRPAAVLIGLIERPSGWHVLLTQRTEAMSQHAGQVSFPGGRMEPSDVSPMAAAIRESEEEVGLLPSQIQTWGYLPRFATISHYIVTPVVAELVNTGDFRAQESEVAEIFEAPLALFADPAQRTLWTREYLGRTRQSYVFPYAGRRIWGATAAMLVAFVDATLSRLREQHANGESGHSHIRI